MTMEMQNDNLNSDIKISELVLVCLMAALVFFSIFWSIRHPENPVLFSYLGLLFLVPQVCFPVFWKVISSRYAPIVLGSGIALVCAIGSLFPLPTALVHVYSAPWFLVIAAYFNLSCLAITFKFLALARDALKSATSPKAKRLFALALLHLSFVVISCGMAIDGYSSKRGFFQTPLKRAPMAKPETGFLANGESSSKMLLSENDPGTDLPFTLKLTDFTVEFFPRQSIELFPGAEPVKLVGFDFSLKGVVYGKLTEPVLKLPNEMIESSTLILEISRNQETDVIRLGINDTSLGDFSVKLKYKEDSVGENLEGYCLEVTAPQVAKEYISTVDLIVGEETILEGYEIKVNKALEWNGYKIFQSSWARLISLEEWEILPPAFHAPQSFKEYLDNNAIPPCTFLMIAITPGRDVVYVGYAIMFLSLMFLLAIPSRKRKLKNLDGSIEK